MASVQVIRDLVSSYIAGAISASDLSNVFPPVFLAAYKSKDIAARDLAIQVRDYLARFSLGVLPEEELFQVLSPIGTVVDQHLAAVSVSIVESAPTNSFNWQRSAVIIESLQPAIA